MAFEFSDTKIAMTYTQEFKIHTSIYTRRETNIQDYITRTYWIQDNRLIQNGKLTFFCSVSYNFVIRFEPSFVIYTICKLIH